MNLTRSIRDGISAIYAWGCAAIVLSLLTWLLWNVLVQGLGQISWAYLSTIPADSGRAGGVASLIVSTVWIIGICIAASLPLGLGTAIFLADQVPGKTPLASIVRRVLDVLASVPSIVIGLFGNSFFCVTLGLGHSILAGGLTLACMVLPIFTRIAEDAIRSVPLEYKVSSAALGLSKFAELRHLILPAAGPAIAIAAVLAVGRALAETAALIFTSGYVTRMPESVFDSGRSLSVHVLDLAMNIPGGDNRAYAAAATLIVLIIVINACVAVLAKWTLGSLQTESRL